MWWLYVKDYETEDRIVYRYSMELYDLDGEIIYDRMTDLFEVTRPCGKDEGSDWCIRRTKEHFWSVIREGFPDRRRVVTG